jgi:YgiT-type zinc finger domain-containing protein
MTDSTTCPLCAGALTDGTTTFTVDYEQGVVVARHVPALVCDQCGEAWLKDDISATLERLVQEARAQHRQVEVVDMAA